MRVVGIAVITALLSAGCALQAGDPQAEDMQRPSELVGAGSAEQPGASAHPQSVNHGVFGQSGPAADSPNPSPWNDQGSSDPHAGNVSGDPSGQGGSNGTGGGNSDNPNPSPWDNPSGPHFGGVGGSGKGGTGG